MMYGPIQPIYFVFILPAFLLGLWAQFRIKSTYAAAQQIPARLSGAAAARHILDSAGLQNVGIEPIGGQLSDHYDPSGKVLRLSGAVYEGRTAAAVGIAAHEAGHALQDAQAYAPLVIRNAAVPAAKIGSGFGIGMVFLGALLAMKPLVFLGIGLFSCVVFFQVINLPVEFNASNRAKAILVETGIVDQAGSAAVNKVLNAAALTYVAATLQAIMTLLYLITRFSRQDRD